MTITRTDLETELISRCKARMQAVEMSVTGNPNADLNSPLAYAIRKSGGTVASMSAVVDGDVASVDESLVDQLLDLAELRLLMNIKGRWAKVDISSGPFSQSLSQFSKDLDTDIAALKEKAENEYGIGSASISIGVLDLNFMQTDPDATL